MSAKSDQVYYYIEGMYFWPIVISFWLGEDIKEGDIRLVGGNNLWQGRVEIFLSGVWGTVSDFYGTSSTAAEVVCRQLGYNIYRQLYLNLTLLYLTCISFLCIRWAERHTESGT